MDHKFCICSTQTSLTHLSPIKSLRSSYWCRWEVVVQSLNHWQGKSHLYLLPKHPTNTIKGLQGIVRIHWHPPRFEPDYYYWQISHSPFTWPKSSFHLKILPKYFIITKILWKVLYKLYIKICNYSFKNNLSSQRTTTFYLAFSFWYNAFVKKYVPWIMLSQVWFQTPWGKLRKVTFVNHSFFILSITIVPSHKYWTILKIIKCNSCYIWAKVSGKDISPEALHSFALMSMTCFPDVVNSCLHGTSLYHHLILSIFDP